jgi:hypothetical protein
MVLDIGAVLAGKQVPTAFLSWLLVCESGCFFFFFLPRPPALCSSALADSVLLGISGNKHPRLLNLSPA